MLEIIRHVPFEVNAGHSCPGVALFDFIPRQLSLGSIGTSQGLWPSRQGYSWGIAEPTQALQDLSPGGVCSCYTPFNGEKEIPIS